mmetsp:Transcript_12701/g.38936  ORF Transcript_12701/g.38936 Transcript_12701/m.38936 type:complete len:167 (-) Transcript_12701:2024-2524(-)
MGGMGGMGGMSSMSSDTYREKPSMPGMGWQGNGPSKKNNSNNYGLDTIAKGVTTNVDQFSKSISNYASQVDTDQMYKQATQAAEGLKSWFGGFATQVTGAAGANARTDLRSAIRENLPQSSAGSNGAGFQGFGYNDVNANNGAGKSGDVPKTSNGGSKNNDWGWPS